MFHQSARYYKKVLYDPKMTTSRNRHKTVLIMPKLSPIHLQKVGNSLCQEQNITSQVGCQKQESEEAIVV